MSRGSGKIRTNGMELETRGHVESVEQQTIIGRLLAADAGVGSRLKTMQTSCINITYHKCVTVKDFGNLIQKSKCYLKNFCLQSVLEKDETLLNHRFRVAYCDNEDVVVIIFWTVIPKLR